MEEELKPCPFCNTEPVIIEYKANDGKRWKYDGVHGYVGCNNDDCLLCGHQDFYFVESNDEDETNKEEAIKFWNNRPIEDELQKELEEKDKYKSMCYELFKALLPLTALRIPDRHEGNTASYNIRFKDIENADKSIKKYEEMKR